jgi:hypothetical protein
MDRSEEIVDNPDGWVAEHIREYVANPWPTGPPAQRLEGEDPPARDPGSKVRQAPEDGPGLRRT